jgi:hypothetical protein
LNRTPVYIAIAAILGLSITLIPAVLTGAYEEVNARFLDNSQDEPVSSTDVKVLGVSFLIASIIFILFKREPGKDNLPPLIRHA